MKVFNFRQHLFHALGVQDFIQAIDHLAIHAAMVRGSACLQFFVEFGRDIFYRDIDSHNDLHE